MPTFFDSASNPADNGSGNTAPVVITPPASMQAGDLCFVTVCFSGTSGTLTVSATGGQTWNSLTTRNQTRNRARSFWCVFNGTWSASPSWTGSSTSNVIARMLVFRPDGGTASSWAVDVAESSATYSAPSSPYTVSITGVTTGVPSVVVIAGWTSADDNTWGSLTAGWTALTDPQIRNTYGTYQQSVSHAYMIKASAGATGNVSQVQATNGGDAGTSIIMAFRETRLVLNVPSPITGAYSQLDTTQYGSAVKVPDPVLAAATEPTPTVKAGELIILDPITGTFSQLTPTPSATRGVNPLDVAVSQPVPTIIGGAVKVSDPILATASQLAPTEIGTALNVPEPIAVTATVLSLGMQTGDTVSPEPVTAETSQIAPTTIADALKVPAPIAATVSVANAPDAHAASVIIPAEQQVTASQPTLAAVGPSTGTVTVTPEPIEMTIDQPTLSLFARALVVIQSAINNLISQLVPVMTATSLMVASPILATASQPEPTAICSAVIVPDAINVLSSQPSFGTVGNVTVSPLPILGSFNIAGVPATEADTVYVPSPIVATASQIEPVELTGGSALILASPIDAQSSQSTPSILAGATIIPEPILGTFSQRTPVVAPIGNPTVIPDPVTGDFAELTPTAIGGAKVVASPIVGAFSQVAPSTMGNILIVPEPVTPTTSPLASTVKAGAIVVADAIEGAFSQPATAMTGPLVISPAPILGHFTLPTAATKLDTIYVPAPIVATTNQPTPSISLFGLTTVHPDPIAGTLSEIAPVIQGDALIIPTPITGTLNQPSPTMGGAVLITPNPITAQTSQLDPTITAVGGIIPAPIAGRFTLPSVTSRIDTVFIPSPIAATTSQPAVYVWVSSVTVTPSPITGTFSEPTPGFSISTVFTPAPITGKFTPLPSVGSSSPAFIEPEPITGAFSQLAPVVHARALVIPAPITPQFTPIGPYVSGDVHGITVAPSAVPTRASLPYWTTSIDAEFVPIEQAVQADQPTPTVVLINSTTVIPAPVLAQTSQSNPIILAGGSVTITLLPIDAVVSLPTPGELAEAIAAPDAISATATLLAPHIAIGALVSVTVAPDPIYGLFDLVELSTLGISSPTVIVEPVDANTAVIAAKTELPVLVEAECIYNGTDLPDPSILISSALVIPNAIDARTTVSDPLIRATSLRPSKPILTDVFGRKRGFDVLRPDPIRDAAERVRIVDIYIGRERPIYFDDDAITASDEDMQMSFFFTDAAPDGLKADLEAKAGKIRPPRRI